MKKSFSILFLLFAISSIAKAQGELNTVIEFYIAKNESAKSAIVTSAFGVKLVDGKSLTNMNTDVKAKLMESLKLSTVIKDGQESQWVLTSVAVTAGGELFEDEKEANLRAEKLKEELKKKGFTITNYPFKYE
jgi:hypothetical protein